MTCALSAVGVVQTARCDGQSQVLHSAQPDPAQRQQRQCTVGTGVAGGTHGRVVDRGLGPQQFHAATPSSVLSAAFRVSAAAAAATPAAVPTSVGESAFYFHDGAGSYRSTPVAAASSYYEKCVI